MSTTKLIRYAKMLFTPVAIAFLLYFCWQAREALGDLIRQASWLMLLLAATTWALLHLLTPLLAVVVLNGSGAQVSWKQAFATHASRLPARYVPGGVWHTVGRVMDYHDQGVKPRQLTTFVILENGLAAAFTLAVGGAIVCALRGSDTVGAIAGLASAAAAVGLLAMYFVINKKVLQAPNALSATSYMTSLLITAAFWAGATIAFLIYLHAFPAATGDYTSVEMGGIYLFSWGVGFAAVFAPQGIGVFELVASELMRGPIGLMGLAALIAGFRVVVGVADLCVWSLFQLTSKRSN
ncbi:MAG: hypothetical protein K0U72_08485 [Gammaproteobacteria bacterium]|nr:hypothetical protein [Gammaproteobacteria bacterium]